MDPALKGGKGILQVMCGVVDVRENLLLSLANCLSFNGHSVVILHGYNMYQGRGKDCEKEFHSTEAMMECITGDR